MDKRGNPRTYLKVFMNLGIMLAAILLLIFVVPRIIVYFMPFVAGWVIALIASPLVRFFEKKLKIKRKASSAFVIILVLSAVIIGVYFIGAKIVEEIADFIEEVPQLWQSTQQDFMEVGQKLEKASMLLPADIRLSFSNLSVKLEEFAGELMDGMGTPTLEALSRFAMNLPTIIIGVIMCLLSSYLFVSDREYVTNLVTKIMPESIMERWHMVKRGLRRAIGGYFKAQLKIELWMYLLLLIGFSILRVPYAFIIAIGVAFLDLLPFFGTGTVLLPWAVIKFLSGDYTMVIGLLIIWGVGQLARQLIQPKIVGDSVGLPPIPTLLLLYIGFKAGGVVGIIIAVPIGLIILNMYEEGVFNTTINSLKILYASISNFRHLKEEDMISVHIYREEEKRRLEAKEKMAKQKEESN